MPGNLDTEDLQNHCVHLGDWRKEPTKNLISLQRTNATNSSDLSEEIRERFVEFFNGIGAVPWQNAMCSFH